ncbi:hypothetical protein FRC07_014682, partial [Ceratobasidium sp. 392]
QKKKQKAAAAARGNTSLPGPLAPRKRRAPDDDDAPSTDGVITSLLDREFDDLEAEDEQLEWLYQAIEQFGAPEDYRADPGFNSVGVLWKVYDDLRTGGLANHNPIPKDTRIRSGLTKVLEPSTSKQSPAPKLVRTDPSTIGLDSIPVKAHNNQRREFGFPPAPKLAWTDCSTITLDGTRLSPPRAQALSKSSSHRQPGSKSAQPPPTTRATEPGASQQPHPKRAIVSRARVAALRKEANARGTGRVAPAGVPGATRDRADIVMHGPSDDDEVMANANEQVRPHTPPTEEERGGYNGNPGKAGASTKRQASQLQNFDPDSAKLVENVMEQLRVEMLVNCPYPERTPSARDPNRQKLDVWVIDLWANANEELRPDEDVHVSYIRHQLAPTRHALKKVCENLIVPHFQLRRSDADRVQHSKDLLNEEKWISS